MRPARQMPRNRDDRQQRERPRRHPPLGLEALAGKSCSHADRHQRQPDDVEEKEAAAKHGHRPCAGRCGGHGRAEQELDSEERVGHAVLEGGLSGAPLGWPRHHTPEEHPAQEQAVRPEQRQHGARVDAYDEQPEGRDHHLRGAHHSERTDRAGAEVTGQIDQRSQDERNQQERQPGWPGRRRFELISEGHDLRRHGPSS